MDTERGGPGSEGSGTDDADPVFACFDRWGRQVVLTKDCWDHHIVAQRPHLVGHEAIVRGVVESPHYVKYDATRANAECFYATGVVPGHPTHVLKVVVKFVREDGVVLPRGFVLSAVSHRSTRSKSGERHKWP